MGETIAPHLFLLSNFVVSCSVITKFSIFKYEHSKKFREICFCSYICNFLIFRKIYIESPDHFVQNYV